MDDDETSIPSKACIWCKSRGDYNLEHIIPEALGCPDWFLLREGVCTSCNSANGTIDNALVKTFELLPFFRGSPRKGGKPPSIDNHSSFAGYHDETGPRLFFNREKLKVELPTGKKLGPTSKRDVIQNFGHQKLPDGRIQVTFNYNFVFERNAVRALFKIALEAVAYHVGLDFVRGDQFDPIRNFVRYNVGNFKALLVAKDQSIFMAEESFIRAKLNNDGTGMISFQVLGMEFICDFDPDFRNGTNTIACGMLTNQRYITLPNA